MNSDSEENYEAMYKRLQASYNLLEKEKKEIDSQLNSLQRKFSDLQNQYEDIKLECTEVAQLRTLNRQLQEKILDQPVALGKFHKGFLYF